MTKTHLTFASLLALGVLALVAIIGALAFDASARAAVIHEYLGSEEPSTYTPFKGAGRATPNAAVVDESVNPADWAKGDTYEAVGTCPRAVAVWTPTREKVGELTIPIPGGAAAPGGACEIAVQDATGDLVVVTDAYYQPSLIELFQPAAFGAWAPPIQITEPSGLDEFNSNHPGGELAVDESAGETGSGDIYAGRAESFTQVIEEFSAGGALVDTIAGTCEKAPEVLPCPGSRVIPLPTFGSTSSTANLSVDPATHYLYVDVGTAVDIFGPDIIVPDVSTGAVSGLRQTSVVLTGTVNPDGEGPASCQFEWGASRAFGHAAACAGEVAEGDSAAPVHSVKIEGLAPSSKYCYRLQATNKAKGSNAGGTNVGEESQDRCFTTPGPKDVEGSVSAVTADSASFDVNVDPRGAPTSYYFEYGTSSAYGSVLRPAPPGASVGSGETSVQASQPVTGLQTATVYHYRVIEVREPVPGETEEFAGPDQTFTTQPPGAEFRLPDGRQWEMVSPPQKLGALFKGAPGGEDAAIAETTSHLTQAAAAGDALVDEAGQPSEDEPEGDANGVVVLMTRGADGQWSSRDISPPHSEHTGVAESVGQEYQRFSEDLSHAALDQFGHLTPLSPEAVEQTPYLRTNFLNGNVGERCEAPDTGASSCFTPLVTRANTAPGTVFGGEYDGECALLNCGPQFVAATPDLSHVLLLSNTQLTSIPNGGLYEWYKGQLQLASILPGQSEGGGVRPPSMGDQRHYISVAGRRVLLGVPSTEGVDTDLYVRDMAKDETVQLNVPEAGCMTCDPGPAKYQTANGEDTRIFFLSTARLTSDASVPGREVSAQNLEGGNLYECAIVEEAGKDACKLTDLTPETGGEASVVESVLGTGEEGSYVYFVASGRLAAGATPGAPNLYVWHEGVTRFIARLSTGDVSTYDDSVNPFGYEEWHMRVSGNGRWLAFMSDMDLTGYDTRDAVSGGADEEVYLYHAPTEPASEAGTLSCASCDPTGARAVGSSSLPAWVRDGGQVGGVTETVYQPRYLDDSGRLFFDTRDSLVPADVDGTVDVYEYEPEGVPAGQRACSAARVSASEAFKPARSFEVEGVTGEEAAGCVALISAGTSGQSSWFLDASETGGDVFFLSTSKLSTADLEGGVSIYDAQECTPSSPCLPEAPVSPPPCDTEASCKASPPPQPVVYGAPASATFSGPGNLGGGEPNHPAVVPKTVTKKPAKCRKGFVKKKLKKKTECVRSRSKKRARKAGRDRRTKS